MELAVELGPRLTAKESLEMDGMMGEVWRLNNLGRRLARAADLPVQFIF